jgi:hypothetical protein
LEARGRTAKSDASSQSQERDTSVMKNQKSQYDFFPQEQTTQGKSAPLQDWIYKRRITTKSCPSAANSQTSVKSLSRTEKSLISIFSAKSESLWAQPLARELTLKAKECSCREGTHQVRLFEIRENC